MRRNMLVVFFWGGFFGGGGCFAFSFVCAACPDQKQEYMQMSGVFVWCAIQKLPL